MPNDAKLGLVLGLGLVVLISLVFFRKDAATAQQAPDTKAGQAAVPKAPPSAPELPPLPPLPANPPAAPDVRPMDPFLDPPPLPDSTE